MTDMVKIISSVASIPPWKQELFSRNNGLSRTVETNSSPRRRWNHRISPRETELEFGMKTRDVTAVDPSIKLTRKCRPLAVVDQDEDNNKVSCGVGSRKRNEVQGAHGTSEETRGNEISPNYKKPATCNAFGGNISRNRIDVELFPFEHSFRGVQESFCRSPFRTDGSEIFKPSSTSNPASGLLGARNMDRKKKSTEVEEGGNGDVKLHLGSSHELHASLSLSGFGVVPKETTLARDSAADIEPSDEEEVFDCRGKEEGSGAACSPLNSHGFLQPMKQQSPSSSTISKKCLDSVQNCGVEAQDGLVWFKSHSTECAKEQSCVTVSPELLSTAEKKSLFEDIGFLAETTNERPIDRSLSQGRGYCFAERVSADRETVHGDSEKEPIMVTDKQKKIGGQGARDISTSSGIHRRASLAKIYARSRSVSGCPRKISDQIHHKCQSRLTNGSSLDSDGTFGSGGESDTSEEIHYGPGFVSKLKNRYMSVALRSSGVTRPALRRTASLENFLEKDKSDEQIELRKSTLGNRDEEEVPSKHKKRVSLHEPHVRGRVSLSKSQQTERRESMKRCQSIEVLSENRRRMLKPFSWPGCC